MRTLSTYIEYLLMTRHYCYVPGKGAYMMSDEPATLGTTPGIGAESRQVYDITAPHRRVYFSALHHHDDGILASLLMEAEGMNYDQACSFIKRQISTLPEDFSDVASLHTDVDNFGFESLKLETWADIEKRQTAAQEPAIPAAAPSAPRLEVHKDSVSIPKYWLKRAAVVTLIALFFFTDFIGLNQNNHQLASVLNISILKRTPLVHQDWEEELDMADDDITEAELDESDMEVAEAESQTPVVAEAPAVASASAEDATPVVTEKPAVAEKPAVVEKPTVVEKPAVAEKPAAEPTKPAVSTSSTSAVGPYFIIVASSYSEEEAERSCRRYQSQGYSTAGVLSRNGLFRVYLNAFAAQGEAANYLREIRKVNERLSKAWMLTVKRDESLSYIIKNIYNDNQLSMELSHPNQRTERDQG